jgi:AcrR family transcriptional regulator
MRCRKQPKERKDQLLTEALILSKELGYSHITRDGVANRAGVSYGLVTRYFDSIDNLKRLVMKKAIKEEVVEIIAQGLVRKDPLTKKLNPQLKAKVLLYLSK